MIQNYALFCLLALVFHNVQAEIIVTLPDGKIRGRKEVTQNKNVTFYAYQQIPYGKPPIGSLRFQAPQPSENWDGILDCTKNERVCYQTGVQMDIENEDCLYLNVYTPVNPDGTKESLTVMFYIYGGGFVDGNSIYELNGPHFFIEDNVIVVTVSYRVGALGFLSTGDEVILGNAGLKDQNLGLKWVQKNIHLFGGDPAKVTIFGQSAGAASVIYQIISPKSTGLFRGAIAQSGTALSPFAYQRNARSIAYQIATFIDPNFNQSSTSKELLQFLQGVNASVIKSVDKMFPGGPAHLQIMHGSNYAPVIEPEVEEAFITNYMYASIVSGNISSKVPLMIGICSEEAISQGADLAGLKIFMQQFDADPGLLVNNDFHLVNDSDKKIVGSKIRSIYTNGLFENDLAAAIRYFSDAAFNRAVIRQAQLQSKYTDVYFYQFSYHGQRGGNNIYVEGAERVGHVEDTRYLWVSNNDSDLSSYPKSDVTTVDRLIRLFTDFSKTLNPTPEGTELLQNIIWPKVHPHDFQYLNINGTLEIRTNPKWDAYYKWVQLYNNFAVKPLDTF